MTDPTRLDVAQLLDAFAQGELTPSAAVAACLARIDEVDGRVNATLTVVAERSRSEASESDRRWRDGTARALEGVPFGLKDIIDTAGVRTTGGSILLSDRLPARDAAVVGSLRRAGAVLVAKLQTYEFAYGGNPHFGPARNPWNLAHSPGGSSDGPGAALAARELPLAVGSDTGGSIRIPASFCGVTGFKPSIGALSTEGVMPQAPTFDHVGPMARSAPDCDLAFRVMSGATTTGGRPASLVGLRVGVPVNWFFDVLDPDVEAATRACADLLAAEGARVSEVLLDHAERVQECFTKVIAPETAYSQRERWHLTSRFGPALAGLVGRGREVMAVDYLHGLAMAELVRSGARSGFESCDVLLMPGTPCVAPRLDDMLAEIGDERVPWLEVVSRTTLWHDVVGCPTVALPFGLGRRGLPLAIQLATPVGSDALCLAVAAAVQELTNYHRAEPPLDAGL